MPSRHVKSLSGSGFVVVGGQRIQADYHLALYEEYILTDSLSHGSSRVPNGTRIEGTVRGTNLVVSTMLMKLETEEGYSLEFFLRNKEVGTISVSGPLLGPNGKIVF